MPWCEKCKLEFSGESEKCLQCGSVLVDKSILSQSEFLDDDNVKEVFLTSVAGDIQSELIESKLRSNGIPVLKKYRETGSYLSVLFGSSNLGINLYVPSVKLEDAKQIIECIEDINEDSEEIDNLNKSYQRKRRIGAWFIIILLVPGLIGLLFIGIKFIIGFW